MNKDALLATIIGFGIGIVITVVILFTPNLAKYFPNLHLPSFSSPTTKTNTQKKNTSTNGIVSFSVESPTEEAIVDKAVLLVSGTAKDQTIIVLEGQLDEKVVEPKDGKFAGEVTLAEGKNTITVTNYQDSTPESKTITVYYTEETF